MKICYQSNFDTCKLSTYGRNNCLQQLPLLLKKINFNPGMDGKTITSIIKRGVQLIIQSFGNE